MIRVPPRLSRTTLATGLIAGLAGSLAAAALAGGPAYMKIGDVKGEASDSRHRSEIEIESWSWGASLAGRSKVEALTIKQRAAAAGGEHEAQTDVQAGESPTAPGEASDRLRTAGPKNGWKAADDGEAEITLKAQPKGARPPGDVILKRGVSETAGGVSVAAGDVTGDGWQRPGAGPGNVRITTKSPWTGCRVGDRYPVLELSASAANYRLVDAVVTSCGTASGATPTEEISFNYTKVDF